MHHFLRINFNDGTSCISRIDGWLDPPGDGDNVDCCAERSAICVPAPRESRIVNTFQSSVFNYAYAGGTDCPASMLVDNEGLEGNFLCNLESTG